MKSKFSKLFLILFSFLNISFLLIWQVPSISASAMIVTANNDSRVDDGICSLHEAIINANNDDQSGSPDCPAGSGEDTLYLSSDVQLTNWFTYISQQGAIGLPYITSNIIIEGSGFTISRSSSEPFRFFWIEVGASLRLSNTNLVGGQASPAFSPTGAIRGGGGIVNYGQLEVIGGSISNNSTNTSDADGGAILSIRGTVIMQDCEVHDNFTSEYASDGGAIGISDGTINIQSCVFSNNKASDDPVSTMTTGSGGAIYANGGDVTIDNSFFFQNQSTHGGGGAIFSSGNLTITNSTFASNQTREAGGAIYAYTDNLVITNTTISGNTALTASGGGLYINGTTATITHNTIVNNVAWGTSAGMDVHNINMLLANNLIAENYLESGTRVNCRYAIFISVVNSRNNLSNDTSCGNGFGTVTPNIDYRSTLADNGGDTMTHALLIGSVAIDTANGGDCPLLDQRHVSRGFDGNGIVNDPAVDDCDIGAYEYSEGIEPTEEVTPEITPEVTPEGTPEVTPEITPEITPEVTPEITPEVTPEITPEITPETTPEVTPEGTPEVTPEITPEVTPEITPEITPEVTPEITPEVTPEVTPEITPEVTPEVTPEATDEPDSVTICHVAGLADDPANYVILELSIEALNGHFDNNGTVLAGHEGDFIIESAEDEARCGVEVTEVPTEPVVTDEPEDTDTDNEAPANNAGNAPNIEVFDPAISKIGFLLPGQVGVTSERLEWIVTVSNAGNISGQNVVVTDTLVTALRVDSVDAPGAAVSINGQTVTVTYPVLNPGETRQFSIFTTVLAGVEVSNTACVAASNQATIECAEGNAIAQLPHTGETPYWRQWLWLLLLPFAGILFVRRKFAR
jgi:uncharacterized repeat protein (TIGR01451 family)